MKKSLVIILTVAILGIVGFYVNNHDKSQSNSNTATNSAVTSKSSKKYADGSYTGDAAETPYGAVEITIVVSGGKISDVQFLQMPKDDQRSVEITAMARQPLKQKTIASQGANIDFVTGATSTSYGYKESLQAALDKAIQT